MARLSAAGRDNRVSPGKALAERGSVWASKMLSRISLVKQKEGGIVMGG